MVRPGLAQGSLQAATQAILTSQELLKICHAWQWLFIGRAESNRANDVYIRDQHILAVPSA